MERHPFDAVSFVFGALFTGLAVVALTDAVTLTLFDLRWLAPAALVVMGLVLLLSSGRRSPRAGEAGSELDDPASIDRA